jgi:hypothetical protein
MRGGAGVKRGAGAGVKRGAWAGGAITRGAGAGLARIVAAGGGVLMIFGTAFVTPTGGSVDFGNVFVTLGWDGSEFVTGGGDVLMILGP